MIDSHIHLNDPRYDGDLEAVMSRDREAGVTHYILAGDSRGTQDRVEEIAAKYPGCFACVGVHPLEMNDNEGWQAEVAFVESRLREGVEKYVAVGEIGLDRHWSKDFLVEQSEALRVQLGLAVEYDLPVILHIREAWDEILPILAEFSGRLRGVAHSFAGTYDNYLALRDLGDYYVGVSGPVTYKNSHLPEVLERIPLERVLLETDGPYLPPVPHRGQRNESGYMRYIVEKIAQIKGISAEQIVRQTRENTIRLFSLQIEP